MQYFVEQARENGINVPVLCGGAAINSTYVNRIARKETSLPPVPFTARRPLTA
jgi:5-methyltetrahydrofolate--homocysteine methyltransferase